MRTPRVILGIAAAALLAGGCGHTVKHTERPQSPLPVPPAPKLPNGSAKGINSTLDQFVRYAVERRNPARAYAVTSAMMRSSQTRKQWNEGTLPVPPFQSKGTSFHGYSVMDASPRQVYLSMVLQPKHPYKQGAISYNIRLSKVHGRWLVDWFTPQAFFAAKGDTPSLFAENDLAPSAGAQTLQHKSHANLVMWGVLAVLLLPAMAVVTLLVVPAIRNRRRRPATAEDDSWSAALRTGDR
jgi:hypothetical protein